MRVLRAKFSWTFIFKGAHRTYNAVCQTFQWKFALDRECITALIWCQNAFWGGFQKSEHQCTSSTDIGRSLAVEALVKFETSAGSNWMALKEAVFRGTEGLIPPDVRALMTLFLHYDGVSTLVIRPTPFFRWKHRAGESKSSKKVLDHSNILHVPKCTVSCFVFLLPPLVKAGTSCWGIWIPVGQQPRGWHPESPPWSGTGTSSGISSIRRMTKSMRQEVCVPLCTVCDEWSSLPFGDFPSFINQQQTMEGRLVLSQESFPLFHHCFYILHFRDGSWRGEPPAHHHSPSSFDYQIQDPLLIWFVT